MIIIIKVDWCKHGVKGKGRDDEWMETFLCAAKLNKKNIYDDIRRRAKRQLEQRKIT